MGALKGKEYEAAAAFIQTLHAHRDPETFPEMAVRGCQRLVGAEQSTWNELAVSLPWARIIADPPLRDPDWVNRTLVAHLHEHPVACLWQQEGDTGVHAISDFLSRRAYHQTGIYQHLYRAFGYEDQLYRALTPPAGHAVVLAFNRDRRGFSARDREMLDLLAPHVLRAWRNVQALSRTERALAGHKEIAATHGQCVIELDAHGHMVDCPAPAERWLRAYFADAAVHSTGRLPASLAAWIRQCLGFNGQAEGHPGSRSPLVRWRGGRRLVMRCFPLPGGGALLALEERTGTNGAEQLRKAGLSQRELDILGELEAGKTNAEVAATLSLSPGTVKKHLDNIYAKLDVSNRTAAVAQLRRA